MTKEATLKDTGNGKAPAEDGWFVLHASEATWFRSARFGVGARFEGEIPFPELGIHLRVLEPGKPACLYHSESAQEDFFVISGRCTLVIEDEERELRAGHFVHCPAGTHHVFVGAGEGPCVVLMVGARQQEHELHYPANAVAARYGASAREATDDPREAYGERDVEPLDEPMWPCYGIE